MKLIMVPPLSFKLFRTLVETQQNQQKDVNKKNPRCEKHLFYSK